MNAKNIGIGVVDSFGGLTNANSKKSVRADLGGTAK